MSGLIVVCDDFQRKVADILSTRPQTGAFRTLIILEDEGIAWIHQCSLAVGWWSSRARRDYLHGLNREPPLWAGLLHPVHLARLCDLSVERKTTLPETVPFDISDYFLHVGALTAEPYAHDRGDSGSRRGYSSIFVWGSARDPELEHD